LSKNRRRRDARLYDLSCPEEQEWLSLISPIAQGHDSSPIWSRPSPEPEPSDEEHQQGLGKLHWGYFASAAGLAVASLAGAVTASALTKQAKDENTQNPTPQTKDTGETRQLAANIMWGVTAATAAGAAVVAIFTRWKEGGEETPQPEDEAPEVTFSVVPGGAGLSVTW
jgi:hypothetical protein